MATRRRTRANLKEALGTGEGRLVVTGVYEMIMSDVAKVDF
jgi:hypothetical protein